MLPVMKTYKAPLRTVQFLLALLLASVSFYSTYAACCAELPVSHTEEIADSCCCTVKCGDCEQSTESCTACREKTERNRFSSAAVYQQFKVYSFVNNIQAVTSAVVCSKNGFVNTDGITCSPHLIKISTDILRI